MDNKGRLNSEVIVVDMTLLLPLVLVVVVLLVLGALGAGAGCSANLPLNLINGMWGLSLSTARTACEAIVCININIEEYWCLFPDNKWVMSLAEFISFHTFREGARTEYIPHSLY